MSHEHVAADHEHEAKTSTQASHNQIEQTEALIGVIDHQTTDFDQRLQAGTPLSPHEIATARSALEQERSELQDHLLQLPPRSPTTTLGFRATDKIARLLERFDALDRAAAAKAAVANESTHESAEDTLADADKSMPTGYCDTAPQGVAPCQLDATRRSLYRRRIESDLQIAATNWVSAIDSKALGQRFKKEGISFEKKLGELLLGSLFGIIGIASKAGVHAGVDRGAEGLAHRVELPNVPGTIVEPIAAGDIAAAKALGETAVSAASTAAQQHLAAQQTHTVEQLAAVGVGAVDVGSSEDVFIDGLRDAPGKWQANIAAHIDSLFDVDLAALALGLERMKGELTVEALKKRIDTALVNFANQVTILDRRTDVIVIGVGMRDGSVKHALVEPERAQTTRFRRDEFPNATVTTGNWKFMRWVDDDLNANTLAHARRHDWSAGASIEAFDDGKFVEGRSFQLLTGRRP